MLLTEEIKTQMNQQYAEWKIQYDAEDFKSFKRNFLVKKKKKSLGNWTFHIAANQKIAVVTGNIEKCNEPRGGNLWCQIVNFLLEIQ